MPELTGRKALSHQRIVDAASRAVRRLGFHGVNVTDVMNEARLTHGGFYAHFASREALLSEAMAQAGVDIGRALREQMARLQAGGASPLRALLDIYLSPEHARDCDNGCPVALLAADMPRQSPEVAEPARGLVVNLHRLVRSALPAHAEPGAAWAVTSAMVGAVQLSRALADADPAAARAVLVDTRKNLLARHDT